MGRVATTMGRVAPMGFFGVEVVLKHDCGYPNDFFESRVFIEN